MVGHSSDQGVSPKESDSSRSTELGADDPQKGQLLLRLPKLQANKCYETMAVTAPTKESIPKRVTQPGARSSEQMTHKGSAATQTTKVTGKEMI